MPQRLEIRLKLCNGTVLLQNRRRCYLRAEVAEINRLLNIEVPIEYADNGLCHVLDDIAAARRADDHANVTRVVEDNSRRHGTAWAFSRLDAVGNRISRSI